MKTLIALILMAVAWAGSASAERFESYFKKDQLYDVYLEHGENVLSVKGVKIGETVDLMGAKFLSVWANSPSSSNGYLRIDDIVAIVPQGQAVD